MSLSSQRVSGTSRLSQLAGERLLTFDVHATRRVDSGQAMSDQNEEIARLQELNSELAESLNRCRRIVRDCREALAANSNDPHSLEDDEETRVG
jgi:hypothetical protein